MSRNIDRRPHLDELTREDWDHIRETARALRDDLDGEEPDSGDLLSETVMTSIGYADVGYDHYENIGWVESYGERAEFDPDGESV